MISKGKQLLWTPILVRLEKRLRKKSSNLYAYKLAHFQSFEFDFAKDFVQSVHKKVIGAFSNKLISGIFNR